MQDYRESCTTVQTCANLRIAVRSANGRPKGFRRWSAGTTDLRQNHKLAPELNACVFATPLSYFCFMQTNRHRPPRLARLSANVRPFYFVTFNTRLRAALLANDDVHRAFLCFCEHAVEHGVVVGRYVLMPDHAHLFVAIQSETVTLKAWVQSLKAILGKALLHLGHKAPHWQEGFFDHVLRSGESYGEKWEYVRQNPVRAGLTASAETWPYQGEVQSIRF